MRIEVLKSKIHRVRITQAELHYVGSITIDEALMEKANLIEGEKVQVVNINNGERIETYTIKGPRDSGTICLNWAGSPKGNGGGLGNHNFLRIYRLGGSQKFFTHHHLP